MDYENYYEVVLIPDLLSLYTYNASNGEIDEFHGELVYGALPENVVYFEEVEFGFCFRASAIAADGDTPEVKASDTWDC